MHSLCHLHPKTYPTTEQYGDRISIRYKTVFAFVVVVVVVETDVEERCSGDRSKKRTKRHRLTDLPGKSFLTVDSDFSRNIPAGFDAILSASFAPKPIPI